MLSMSKVTLRLWSVTIKIKCGIFSVGSLGVVANGIRCCSLLLFLAGQPLHAQDANHEAPIYTTLETCLDALEYSGPAEVPISVDPSIEPVSESVQLKVLSWNIEKGKNPGWKKALQTLAENVDFVLLQEAVFVEEMQDPQKLEAYWTFAQGYTTKNYRSGIMTIARAAPDYVCNLQVTEPWLRSPKLVSISRYQVESLSKPLLVVNLHAINFTLGTTEFAEQMRKARVIAEKHAGPIVMAGDFNTWNTNREKVLQTMMEELEFDEVVFTEDKRVRTFDHVLDYVFVKGFRIESSSTLETDSSDHNPLIVTLLPISPS